MMTPTQWLGLIIVVQHAIVLLPGRLAVDGLWIHAGATIGLAGQVVGCANCAAGAAATIALLAVAMVCAARRRAVGEQAGRGTHTGFKA